MLLLLTKVMKEKPTWSMILGSLLLIVIAYNLGGFFVINYVIGGLGLLLGLYNLYQERVKVSGN